VEPVEDRDPATGGVVFRDVTGAGTPALAARLEAIRKTGLSASADASMDRLAALAARLLSTRAALVTLVDDTSELVPGQSGLPWPWAQHRRLPLGRTPATTVVEHGAVIQIDRARHLERRTAPDASLKVGSFLGVPLVDERGTVIGSLSVIEPGMRKWTVADRELLGGLAMSVSFDLRARIATAEAEQARAEAAKATSRLRVMAEASSVLLATLDHEVTLTRILDTIVPRLATWTLLVLAPVEDEGPRVLTRHVDPASGAELDRLAKEHADKLLAVPVIGTVMHGRGARRLTRIAPGAVASDFGSAELAATIERLGVGSVMIVPLAARTGILGALAFVASADRSPYDEVDLTLAVDLGRRCALAIDNTRRYERERTVALELQRSLLPELAQVDGVEACAAYEPASTHSEIGGDWYDLMRAPDGALTAMIGDVTGHNVRAAAAMGRVRGALRAYAFEGHGPGAVLERVERIAEHLLDDLFVTCAVVRLEPAGDEWKATCANAGHLPPLVLDPDGRAHFIDLPDDPLIGITRTPAARRVVTEMIALGSTIVLYTDGIVERRRQQLDDGLDRLREAVERHGHSDPMELLCKRLVGELDPDGRDDVAILALRTTSPSR